MSGYLTGSTPVTIASLTLEVQRLQQRVRDLERALLADFVPPIPLPRMEIMVLQCLLKHKLCTNERLNAALDHGGRREAGPCVVQSHVSKLRKKLSGYGVKINQSRYSGYWITPEDKQKIYDLCAKETMTDRDYVPSYVRNTSQPDKCNSCDTLPDA